VTAAIIAIGDELLAPGRVETNSAFLTDELARAGIRVGYRAVVGDDDDAIARATRDALVRNDLVFLTGGLGPTSDDRTRDAVATALELEMSVDESILRAIQARFDERGLTMPDVNRRQAMVPREATVLPNRHGTAPGLWITPEAQEFGARKLVVLLPGPPAELQPMYLDQVAMRLADYSSSVVYDVRKLWVAGLPESAVEQKILSTYRSVDNPSTSLLASSGQVEIRLTANAASADEAAATNERLASRLRKLLGEAIFSESEQTLEAVIGGLLLARNQRITVAESLTGGLIAHRITDVPGSSQYFDESFVTYSNEAKTELLGVPAGLFGTGGAVSEDVARAMAVGARRRARSDLAVAVTGIAGPGGGTETKPVGLVFIGLATAREVRVERFHFPGGRRQIKRWSSQAALNMVRLELLKELSSSDASVSGD
jgi:nicotinamide-nucleotide amidase